MQAAIASSSGVFSAPLVPQAIRPVRRPVGRWLAGGLAAVLVHGALAAAVVGLAPETRFRELPEGAFGPEMSVSLEPRGPGAAAADQASAEASPLDSLLDSLASPQAAASQGAGPADHSGTPLSDLFGEAPSAAQGGGGAPGAAKGPTGSGGGKPGFDYGAQASVARRRPGAGGGPVPPCWGRPERPVPVIMAILLDEDGVLVGRPRIISVGAGPGDPRAAEYERTAMRAMAGCAPFSLAPPGVYEAYRIDFSREKGGLIRLGPMAPP